MTFLDTRPARTNRALAGLALALACSSLAACSSSSDEPSSAGSPTTSAPASSPFDVAVTGPTQAQPGQKIAVTLSNNGRLPDAYQLEVEPAEAATLTARDAHLGAGESMKIRLAVHSTPFVIRVKSVGAGGEEAAEMSVS